MNTGISKLSHRHNHTHEAKLVDFHVQEVIGKDGALAQDRSVTRAQFQGRFRATCFGDFKNRPGFASEMVEAQVEDHEREDAKAEEAAKVSEIVESAATEGVVLETEITSLDEEIDLHRLADDGGPALD